LEEHIFTGRWKILLFHISSAIAQVLTYQGRAHPEEKLVLVERLGVIVVRAFCQHPGFIKTVQTGMVMPINAEIV
jgi:hypothetical protein